MNQFKLPSILLILFSFLSIQSFGQGCSDAGFCTMNTLKPHCNPDSVVLNSQFKLGTFFGSADHDISVYGAYVEYNRKFGKSFGFDVKLTSLGQQGNDISVFGLSDLFVSGNYHFNTHLNFTLGAKIPLNDANKFNKALPLPMDYQSSLGTFDLIVGIGYEFRKIQVVAAIQQPLTQNGNQFFASYYPPNSNLNSFQSTNKYTRSGDLLLRLSYPISAGSKLILTPSLLPIYHLQNDQYTNEVGVQTTIQGSQGLTLNGNLYVDYKLSNTKKIQLNAGAPFVTRDARPDGLTRGFIANVEYSVQF